jgi:hypothetical protein
MNDIYARRAAKTMMFQQAYRSIPTLWNATRVTKEKLDGAFVAEEFMRVNGQRTMPLLIGDVSTQTQHNSHWVHLNDTAAWAECGRAFSQNETEASLFSRVQQKPLRAPKFRPSLQTSRVSPIGSANAAYASSLRSCKPQPAATPILSLPIPALCTWHGHLVYQSHFLLARSPKLRRDLGP